MLSAAKNDAYYIFSTYIKNFNQFSMFLFYIVLLKMLII